MTVLLLILIPWLGALLPPWMARWGAGPAALAAAVPTAAALGVLMSLTSAVLGGEVPVFHQPWVAALDWNLALRLDGLALLFSWLVLGIGLLVVIYGRFYLSANEKSGRFFAYLLLFMGAMMGVVLADDAVVLVAFWELTSLSSFLLIGFWSHVAAARQGARMALTVTGAGGLALLGGVLILSQLAGTTSLHQWPQQLAMVDASSPWLQAAIVLVLLGACTKSAQFPFHFWLPRAMAAPTPVSAYLHSATMVKAGVFLMLRLAPSLGGHELWLITLTVVGLTTMVVGAWLANLSQDLKGLLAYSTVSHLGLITALVGFGSPAALVAALLHVLNHAVFKAALFMNAGIVDHALHTRDLRRLGGLAAAMPISAAMAALAAASMAGLPPFGGFLSKELFLEHALHVHWLHELIWLPAAVATFGAILSVAYSVRYVFDTYGGAPREAHDHPHDPVVGLWVPPALLAVLALLLGLAPALLAKPLVRAAALSLLGPEMEPIKLKLWHGLTLALGLSAVAVVGGLAVFAIRQRWITLHERTLPLPDARVLFDRLIETLLASARWSTATLLHGGVTRSVGILMMTTVAVVLVGWKFSGFGVAELPVSSLDPLVGMSAGLMIVGVVGTVRTHRARAVSVTFLSVVGLGVSLIFVQFSAPDLAVTQLSVEVVTIVLLLLSLHLLPATTPRESSLMRRSRDGAVAGAAGGVAAVLTWMMMSRPVPNPISAWHLGQSKPEGGGTNVVNVILVDFRGFDTFGEVTVLGIAALGIYALIDGAASGRPFQRRPADDESSHPAMLVVSARVVLPLAIMVAAYLFLRGHNQPGGGFVAGLVVAVAIVLQYLASGLAWTQERIRVDYHPLIAAGVLTAGLTGVGAWLWGLPFLTSWFDYFDVPILGKFELASAMLFDTGVFLTVVGAVLLVLVNLARFPRARSGGRVAEGVDTDTGVMRAIQPTSDTEGD